MSSLTVSQILAQFERVLKGEFSSVSFVGEISSAKIYPSGHLYLTIKDEQAELSGVMWKAHASRLTFTPKVGDAVQCVGTPAIYAQRGQLQVQLTKIEPTGEGLLQKKFLALKARLEGEGLFAPERKRPLPTFPKAIGLVTSKAGAVIRDIDVKVKERLPSMKIFLADTRVQGEGSAAEIADSITRLGASGRVDVIILARGGGSAEDLWSFNEEVVVRAIFASPVPVVSGVGHETDFTLADFVADRRAPTPTAAAELVTPSRVVLLRHIADLERRLNDLFWFDAAQQRLDEVDEKLRRVVVMRAQTASLILKNIELKIAGLEPTKIIHLLAERLDAFENRLQASASREVERAQNKFQSIAITLKSSLPEPLLRQHIILVNTLTERLRVGGVTYLNAIKHQFYLTEGRLEGVSPAKILERGYSVVEAGDGTIIRDPKTLNQGDAIKILFAAGTLPAQVVAPLVVNKIGGVN